MAYKKVTRVITVEFIHEKKGKGYQVLVTPEQAVVRYKDTVQWDVQGLPQGLALRLSVGNFQRLDASSHIARGKGGLAAGKPKGPGGQFSRRWDGNRLKLTLPLNGADPGIYKYDLLGDGKTLFDPEMEIKGPKS